MAPSASIPISALYAVTIYAAPSTGLNLNWSAARAAYLADPANGGNQAPPYNPQKPVQLYNWPSGAETTCLDTLDANKDGYVQAYTPQVSANIPGAYNYPPYVIEPTTATVTLGTIELTIPANYICSLEAAQQVLAAINALPEFAGENLVLNENAFYAGANWGTETRRGYGIICDGLIINCGFELAGMSYAGVGYPGALTYNETTKALNWVPETPNTVPPVNYQTAPIPLLPIPTGFEIAVAGAGLFTPGALVLQPIPPSALTLPQQLAAVEQQIAVLQAEAAALQSQISAG